MNKNILSVLNDYFNQRIDLYYYLREIEIIDGKLELDIYNELEGNESVVS